MNKRLLLPIAVFLCVSITFVPANSYADSDQLAIPSWIKQIAVFWGNGEISDVEFITALQYLVKTGILVVPTPDSVQADSFIDDTQVHTPNIADNDMHPDAVQGTITRIVDGDTLVFDGITYRLALIDTPERGEDGYSEAANALKALCPQGSMAYMEDDSIQGLDKYERSLGVVWCEGNNYATTAGEYLSDHGLLKKFYTDFCGKTEAATVQWAEASGNWFYYSVCN